MKKYKVQKHEPLIEMFRQFGINRQVYFATMKSEKYQENRLLIKVAQGVEISCIVF